MPWDASPNAGFTTGTPWLPLNADWPTRNVAAETEDAGSMLALHRDLLRLRRAHKALAIGEVRLIEAEGDILAYERTHDGERIVVVLNLGDAEQSLPLPVSNFHLLLSTLCHPREGGDPYSQELEVMDSRLRGNDGKKYLSLAPNEGLILLA
jgi:alpha-glucosidase